MTHPIKRALLSVSDKTGLVDLAQALHTQGIEIVSTGGTAKTLKAEGLPVLDASEVTGFPEILDGRVKTLHPAIHGGILAKRQDDIHRKTLEDHKIKPIDLVVVNLYPFAKTVAAGKSWQACIEQIDIGGPAMVRAAAKNHHDVAILTHPDQYEALLEELKTQNGATSLAFRQQLAGAAFEHTAAYDAMVARAFAGEQKEPFPTTLLTSATRVQTLRYGENPHQSAALYRTDETSGVANARQIQGKPLSYNNINDTDAALALVNEFDDPCVAIIKHANPCGVAMHREHLIDAWKSALACDPVSAFGGVIALNRPLDKAVATEISQMFVEVIIAPGMDHEAEIIMASKKNVRILITENTGNPATDQMIKTIQGGFLVQDRDTAPLIEKNLKTVTKRAPTKQELQDLCFAFRVGKHVKSNAIVYVRHQATVGIGAGQMSRVDAARIAIQKAEDVAAAENRGTSPLHGAVVASDAFFPFADGLLAAAGAGVTAVIQPGGSIRDDEVIEAANKHDIAMVFTGQRHFLH